MPIPIRAILALLLAIAYPTGGEPLRFVRHDRLSIGGARVPVALVAFVALTAGCAAWTSAYSAASARAGAVRRPALRLADRVDGVLPLAAFAALIEVFHFPIYLEEETPFGARPSLVLVGTALPYAVFAAIAMLGRWREERAHSHAPGFPIRLRLAAGIAALPFVTVLGVQVLAFEVPAVEKWSTIVPATMMAALIVLIAALLAAAPFLLRLGFGAVPMDAGELRERLEAVGRRVGFRCRDMLVLGERGSGFSNAFITGAAPCLRYVFFSRDLLAELAPDEIESVFAHEVAHVQRRHLGHYAGFALGSILLAASAAELWCWDETAGIALLVVASFAWLAFFVYLSRRFESEADLRGAGTVGSAVVSARALERVALANGMDVFRSSWRHFSVARRVEILMRAEREPDFAARYLARAAKVRVGLRLVAILGLAAFAASATNQLRRMDEGRKRWAAVETAREGAGLIENGDMQGGARRLEEAVNGGFDVGALHVYLARAYAALHLPIDADAEREKARQLGVTHPRLRLELER